MAAQTGSAGALNDGGDGYGVTGERGSRRKKLAGYLKAANELRQSYRDAYVARGDRASEQDDAGIPGAFPDLVVARGGVEEMVLFPSYARRHTKVEKPSVTRAPGVGQDTQDSATAGDAEYWQKEWEVYEDANGVADVDVRGWIYSPNTGPMTRKNRLLFGIARHLSGIPAPSAGTQTGSRASSRHDRASERDEEMVEMVTQQITQRGRREADIAGRGGYSEGIEKDVDLPDPLHSQYTASRSQSPRYGEPKSGDFPHPLTDSSIGSNQMDHLQEAGVTKRTSWNQPSRMSSAELAIANNHLMDRLKPFLTNPSIGIPITIFFYNEHTSQSRTTHTNEAGHFNVRAALNFVPTHLRVLASSDLSATEKVHITEPMGVSLISDIDDTIKHSAIGSGAKEIFRNTFIRELGDLTVEGVKEWYNKLSDMDVKLHYVSNAPWQLYPVLVSYFALAGLPLGSFHLKQYSGMLQGIFEPVAERKRGTLSRILGDFPERRFILVGDSGEADLELYTEIVRSNPGRILGIFIRDVTTAPNRGFFDSSMGPLSGGGSKSPLRGQISNVDTSSSGRLAKPSESRPSLPPRPVTDAHFETNLHLSGPIMGDLIVFDDEPESLPPSRSSKEHVTDSRELIARKSSKSNPPDRPSKPIALRSASADLALSIEPPTGQTSSGRKGPVPPPKPRKYSSSRGTDRLTDATTPNQILSKSPLVSRSNSLERQGYRTAVKNKVASAYNALPSPVAYFHGTSSTSTSPTARPDVRTSGLSTSPSVRPPPPTQPKKNVTSYPGAAAQYATNRLGINGDQGTNPVSPLGKREELWKRRWARAKEILDEEGVLLRAWRVGDDVMDDSVKLVTKAQREDRGEAVPPCENEG